MEADPEDTTVKHPDGSYDTPKPPGIPIIVNPGDEVETPSGTIVITEPQPGGTDDGIGQGGGEEIIGGGPFIITSPGVFTSPKPDFEKTQLDNTLLFQVVLIQFFSIFVMY